MAAPKVHEGTKAPASTDSATSTSLDPVPLGVSSVVIEKNEGSKIEMKAESPTLPCQTAERDALTIAPVSPTPYGMSGLSILSQRLSLSSSTTSVVVFSPRDPSSKLAFQPLSSSRMRADFVATSSSITTPAQALMSSAPKRSTRRSSSADSSSISEGDDEDEDCSLDADASDSSQSDNPDSSGSPKSAKVNTGRWTDAEHKLFLKGLETFPYRAWKKIATLIKTRTVVQIRTHAQKYYQKLAKEESKIRDREVQHSAHFSLAKLNSSEKDSGVVTSSSCDERALGKKANLRKRKPVADEPVAKPSKRQMREKRATREKHISPRHKLVESHCSSDREREPPNASASKRVLDDVKVVPTAFDDTSNSLILDFVEEKPVPGMDYPLALECETEPEHQDEHELPVLDQDEFMQLTEEESLDWFSGDSTSGFMGESSVSMVLPCSSPSPSSFEVSPASSPLTFSRFQFSPIYQHDSDATFLANDCPSAEPVCGPGPVPVPVPVTPAFEDDEDFVLDPEKFLSSYFSPVSSR